MTIQLAILLIFFTWLITYIATRGSYAAKVGKMSEDAYGFPYEALFKVLYTDRIRTVLEQQSSQRETWTVSTKVFIGRPIRPGDIVRHVKDTIEMKALGIPIPQRFDVFIKDTKNEELAVS